MLIIGLRKEDNPEYAGTAMEKSLGIKAQTPFPQTYWWKVRCTKVELSLQVAFSYPHRVTLL